MKTLVIGASHKPERYSNKAMNLLHSYGHEVLALGRRERPWEHGTIDAGKPRYEGVDTVTLYLNPTHQEEYYEYITQLGPRRVIFNPGAENRDMAQRLEKEGITTEEACTLVLLRSGQF